MPTNNPTQPDTNHVDKIDEIIGGAIHSTLKHSALFPAQNEVYESVRRKAKAQLRAYIADEVRDALTKGIILGWEESSEGYNNEYNGLSYVDGKRYTEDEVLAKIVKDVLDRKRGHNV